MNRQTPVDSMHSQRLVITLLALLSPASSLGATHFGAAYEQSRWDSRREGASCQLSHSIPRFGLALFSQDAHGRLGLTIYAHRPPAQEGRATLYSRSPEWKPVVEQKLDGARLRADGTLFRLSHYNAQRLLAELEQGQEPAMRFEGWWRDGVTELTLSPVNFRPALRAHFACLAALPQPTATAAAGSDPALLHYRPAGGPALGTAIAPTPAKVFVTLDSPAAVPAQDKAVIYFATDNAGLDLLALDTLRRFAARLRAEPDKKAVVSGGHADARGSQAYNRALAEQRAAEVEGYLIELGIDPARIQVRSFGDLQPVTAGRDRYELAENRRVVLMIGD
jgi:outer membrane protein OmpA-like peptidoglycan-associated protein